MFELKQSGGTAYYTVSELEETGLVKHGFSTRRGGVSTGIFSQMNFRPDHGDSPENIKENFRIFSEAVGVEYNKLVLSRQVHETQVRKVTIEDAGNGLLYENRFESADALMTDVPGLGLIVFYADCVPVLFLDPGKKAVAAVHSGWRGTVGGICEKTVGAMAEAYGSCPRDIICAVGPSIGECCYEVSCDVAERFAERFGPSVVRIAQEGGIYVSLQKAVGIALKEAGMLEEKIIQAGVCTSCHSELLFSHRKTQGQRGTMGAVIALK